MTSLDQAFRDLCAKHDLNALSLAYSEYGFTAYAHYNYGKCASGHGATAEESLANAIREANELRGAMPAIDPLTLTAAEMAQLMAEDNAADRREAVRDQASETAL